MRSQRENPSIFLGTSRVDHVEIYLQPTAADIKRKNANFASRAVQGKRTARPARSTQKRSAATWVLIGMGFLLVGGSEF